MVTEADDSRINDRPALDYFSGSVHVVERGWPCIDIHHFGHPAKPAFTQLTSPLKSVVHLGRCYKTMKVLDEMVCRQSIMRHGELAGIVYCR